MQSNDINSNIGESERGRQKKRVTKTNGEGQGVRRRTVRAIEHANNIAKELNGTVNYDIDDIDLETEETDV